MKNYILIDLLRTLSGRELKHFERFLEANTNKEPNDVKSLFNYLKKYHPIFKGREVERKYSASRVFKADTEEKALKKMDNSKLGLRKLLELFLAQEEVKKQKKEYDFLLLSVLRDRGLDDYFFRKIDRIEKEWTKNPEPGIKHIHDIYRLKEMRFSHPNYDFSKVESGPQMLLEIFEQYYIAVKLYWTLCAYNTNNFFANREVDLIIPIESVLEFINIKALENPQIKLLSEIFNTFVNKDFENYWMLKSSCLEQLDNYTDAEKHSLIAFLSTIGFKNYRLGNNAFIEELFQLSCLLIEKDLLVENGYIANDVFIEIVNNACVAQKLEWVEGFIDKYLVFIKENERADVGRLTRATLYFNKQDYQQVLDELCKLNFHNIVYSVQARAILLRAYFELADDYDLLFSDLVKSFNAFLTRDSTTAKSLSELHKEGFINFIKFTNTLHKNRQTNTFDFIALKEEILACTNLVYRSWLLSKI